MVKYTRSRSIHLRTSKELAELVNYIKSKHILAGKIPPTTNEITRRIAKRINRDELLYDEFIRF